MLWVNLTKIAPNQTKEQAIRHILYNYRAHIASDGGQATGSTNS
ncbi:hypothetical protein ALT1644_490019 [Alteromonas macleodii]